MTEHEPLDPVDRLLHEAGHRLQASAPDQAATDTALEYLDDRHPGRRRIWWIAPTVIAAAAASVLAVVLVTRSDETVRDVVPADTTAPSVATTVPVPTTESPAAVPATTTGPATTVTQTTVAPTTTNAPTTTTEPATTTTTTATTVPPVVAPVFVGDLPLDASAAVLGCPGTLGDLADVIPPESLPIVSLACSGDYAVVATTGHPDGTYYEMTWTGTWSNDGGGTSSPCDLAASAICEAFGNPEDLYDVTRPLPPAWLIEDPNHSAGIDVTDELTGLGLAVQDDAETFAAALGDRLVAITPGDPVTRAETAVLEGVQVVTVTLSGIPDDSSSSGTYVVRYNDIDGTLSPANGLLFYHCDRGGGAPDLCV